jgi:glycosyltransferase involved in cell wall biosynthesis
VIRSAKPSLVVDVRMISHSGIGTYLRNILGGLQAAGNFRMTLLGNEESLKKHGLLDGVDCIPIRAPIYWPQEQLELVTRIPKCDVFWSPHFNVPFFPVRARKRIATIHDAYHLAHPNAFGRLTRVYSRVLFRAAVRLSDRIITVSEFSKGEIIRFVGGAEKLRVIPNGVDPAFGRGFTQAPIQENYVLFVGNIKPHKNLMTLLRAFALLEPEYPDLKLFIVGRNEGLLNADNTVVKLINSFPGGKVRMLGEVSLSELKNYYANASLFAFPSCYEGFGLPLLEAMCFDIPIVSSNAGPMMEVGGDAVTYFNPENPSEMALAMKTALQSPRSGRVETYSKQTQNFNWAKSVTAHQECILSTLTNPIKSSP